MLRRADGGAMSSFTVSEAYRDFPGLEELLSSQSIRPLDHVENI